MEENKAEKITPIIIDGFEINAQNVTYQKLQEFSLVLFEKLLNYRRERNFLLLDRDKWRTILENLHHEIKVAKDTSLNKEQELEQAQERYRKDYKEIDQEVKYIYYDHDINLADLKVWEKKVLEDTELKCLEEELELLKSKRDLKVKLAEQEIKDEEELLNIKKQLDEEVEDLKIEHEKKRVEKEIVFRKQLNSTVDLLTLKHEMEMSEVEERKNSHLAELKLIHKTRIEEMKNYFNLITSENLSVIANLKQGLDAMKKNESSMSDEVKQLKQENKMLAVDLKKSKAEVKNLTRQLINYEKDLLSLKNNKRLLKETLENTIQIKNESSLALEKIKNNEMSKYGESLDSEFTTSLMVFLEEADYKRHQLEEQITFWIHDLRKKQHSLGELSSDPDIQEAINELRFEYLAPRKLSYELEIICKAHDDLLQTLRAKLKEFCLPEQELNFDLINEPASIKNPSSLVAKQ